MKQKKYTQAQKMGQIERKIDELIATVNNQMMYTQHLYRVIEKLPGYKKAIKEVDKELKESSDATDS